MGYLSDSYYQILAEHVKVSFGCLHGMVRAALLTSTLILSLARLSAVFN